MVDIITDLLERKFSTRPHEEKLRIFRAGRPTPELPNLKSQSREKSREYTRSFSAANYPRFVWLTGSNAKNKLFCWPCILFGEEQTTWNYHGLDSLNGSGSAFYKHQRSMRHIKAFNDHQMFGRSASEPSSSKGKMKIEDSLHNAKVKENRIVLKKLIDVIAFLGRQGYVFGVSDSPNGRLCEELLEFLTTQDPILASHLKTDTVFKGISTAVHNDLIASMHEVINQRIKQELLNCSFVAILLKETANTMNGSRLSTSVRYVDDEGHCRERFLYFSDISSSRTAQGLFQHISKTVLSFECAEKLVALSFDGATLMANQIPELQALMEEQFPVARIVHSLGDNLGCVLADSTRYISECKRFFIELSAVSSFFARSASRVDSLKSFMMKFDGTSPTKWNFAAPKLPETVRNHRGHLVQFFQSVLDNAGDWTGEDFNAASGIIAFLSRFQTKFFLVVFAKVFGLAEILSETLRVHSKDVQQRAEKVWEFQEALRKFRDEDFEQVWLETTHVKDEGLESKRRKTVDEDERSECKCIFIEVLNSVETQVALRFDNPGHEDLDYVNLLSSAGLLLYGRDFCAREKLLMRLRVTYRNVFDAVRIKNEFIVFNSLMEYKDKSLEEISAQMRLNKLELVFSELLKLSELILTLPSTALDDPEEDFHVSERIEAYLRCTRGLGRSSSLASLAIEKRVLLNMRQYFEDMYYEHITQRFIQKEPRTEFMYR